jgi:hypothetical protein
MVCEEGAAEDEEEERAEAGWVQNQKQEPHTKMWGKISSCENPGFPIIDLRFSILIKDELSILDPAFRFFDIELHLSVSIENISIYLSIYIIMYYYIYMYIYIYIIYIHIYLYMCV